MNVSVIVAVAKERFAGRILEWYVAAQLLMWGLVLIAPEQSFSFTPTFFVYFPVSEDVLGPLMLGLGLVRLAALIINGAIPGITPLIRVSGAFLGCGVWYLISIYFAETGQVSVWIAAWPMAFFAEFVNMYRSAQDARIGIHRARLKRARGGTS